MSVLSAVLWYNFVIGAFYIRGTNIRLWFHDFTVREINHNRIVIQIKNAAYVEFESSLVGPVSSETTIAVCSGYSLFDVAVDKNSAVFWYL